MVIFGPAFAGKGAQLADLAADKTHRLLENEAISRIVWGRSCDGPLPRPRVQEADPVSVPN